MEKATGKEVDHGWALPLTIDSVHHIKNVGVIPLGISEKFSVNEKEEIYKKSRINHDCSFLGSSGLLLNNRILKEKLQPRFYKFCLLTILHMLVAMQIRYPSKSILIRKTDLGAAYRYIHANAQIVSTYIAIMDKLALLCLHLPL